MDDISVDGAGVVAAGTGDHSVVVATEGGNQLPRGPGWTPAPPPHSVGDSRHEASEVVPSTPLAESERKTLLRIALLSDGDDDSPLIVHERAVLMRIALADNLPKTGALFESVDVSHGPKYTVKEAGRFFFQKSASWMRWRESLHLSDTEAPPQPDGKRIYDLATIERIAHALARSGAIDDAHLLVTLKLLALTAWGYKIPANNIVM